MIARLAPAIQGGAWGARPRSSYPGQRGPWKTGFSAFILAGSSVLPDRHWLEL